LRGSKEILGPPKHGSKRSAAGPDLTSLRRDGQAQAHAQGAHGGQRLVGSAMSTPEQDRVEHRRAAILSADVAGYSRLPGPRMRRGRPPNSRINCGSS
jgi:hypothetical protein